MSSVVAQRPVRDDYSSGNGQQSPKTFSPRAMMTARSLCAEGGGSALKHFVEGMVRGSAASHHLIKTARPRYTALSTTTLRGATRR
jgi:hypothetical protein